MSALAPDLRFLLSDWLGLDAVLARPRHAHLDLDAIGALVEAAERLAREHLAPHAAKSDAEEPRLVDGRAVVIPEVRAALDACRDAGFFALDAPADEGGLALPALAVAAIATRLTEANAPTWAYAFLTMAAANLIRHCAAPGQRARWLPPMVEGRWFGTMCLSEPHAGSSVGDIRTVAEPQADGSYRLRGTKMWISGGDHELSENIVHLVLAKIPGGPPGTRGISLFIVPRLRAADASLAGLAATPSGAPAQWVRNGITLAGLNHKLGYRGTVNCLLNLGEDAPCVGELVGAPHQGMAQMFRMMNEARIGVGAGAAAIGLAGFRAALGYARERTQGRAPGERDPSTPMRPIIEHADVRRMLLESKAKAEGAFALVLWAARLADDIASGSESEAAEAQALLDLVTPIVKTWPSTHAITANDLAIQVLGGAGYVRDFPVERLWRDNRLNAIHEGTTGIQGMDLVGRKILGDGGRALGLLARRIADTCRRAADDPAHAAHGAAIAGWLPEVDATVRALAAEAAAGRIDVALANATLLLDALGHLVVAWLWLDQALAARRALATAPPAATARMLEGRLACARWFIDCELPTKRPLLAIVARLDRTVLATSPEVL
jgi:butyryl-CoA dehydrogenase